MEEINKNVFNRLLQDGEEVLHIIKPNRRRFVGLNNLATGVLGTLFMTPFFVIPILGIVGVIASNDGVFGFWIFLGFSTLFAIVIFSNLFLNSTRYKHTFYGITNKRLLIQEGAFSMSYRSYDLAEISSIDVRIGFFDRLMHPETGSLYFYTVATAAAAYVASNGNRGNTAPKACIFNSVDDPYSWYKKINDMKAELDAKAGR